MEQVTNPTIDEVEPTQTPSTKGTPEREITEDKEIRRDLDSILQRLKGLMPSRERSLSITKIQEAIMWLGMDLKRLNDGISCYTESYNPNNTIVHPTSDGVKL